MTQMFFKHEGTKNSKKEKILCAFVFKFSCLLLVAALHSDLKAQGSASGPGESPGSDIERVFDPVRDWTSNAMELPGGYRVSLHGKIQLDTIWEETHSYPGYYSLYGITEQFHKDDEQFYMTANQSRLTIAFLSPEKDHKRLSGLIEADLMGDPVHGKPELNLRHAYLTFAWGQKWELLAGQTWDVISPLRIPLLEWNYGWGWGNIGYWHPQLRISYTNAPLDAQFAMSQPVGADVDRNGINDGQDAFLPNWQGRVGFKINKVSFGFSGHWGWQEFRFWGGSKLYRYTWSGNLDLAFPVKNIVMVTGEYFVGQNLEGYMGGVMQGIHIYTDTAGETVVEGYPAMGGWINFAFEKDKWKWNLGGSIDTVHRYKLHIGDRQENLVFWGNVLYEFFPRLDAGFEFFHMETLYWKYKKGEPNRYQLALIYNF